MASSKPEQSLDEGAATADFDFRTLESVRDGLRSRSGVPLRRLMVANRGVRISMAMHTDPLGNCYPDLPYGA